MKKVLITGITGFAGPHLANLLAKDEDIAVYGLVRASNGRENDIRDIVNDDVFSTINFVYADLRDKGGVERVLRQVEPDEIYHLAAQSHPPTSFIEPYNTFMANAIGTANIVDYISNHLPECKLMNCSTSEVYGSVPKEDGMIKETRPLAPINPYGVSKAAADMYVRERAKSLNRPYFCTRAFSHTGPRRGNRFSLSSDAHQIARIKKDLQEPIIHVGDLSSRRMVMDVRDCVRAYVMLMDKAECGEAYNVGGGTMDSIGGFLNAMLDMSYLSGRVEIMVDKALLRPIDIPIQRPDSRKLQTLTGWKTEISVEDMLYDLIEYWTNKI